MTKFLVPIDASKPSRQAVRFATSLAAAEEGASMTLLHVLPPLPPGKTVHFIDSDLYKKHQKEDAMEQLKPLVQQAEQTNIPFETYYEIGIPHETIAHFASQNHDLIVMGTHGYGRITGWMMGSVGYPILGHLPVPVILVPEEAHADSAPKKILVAVDGSEHARQAARTAIELGKKTGAEFLLFNAVGWSLPHSQLEALDADFRKELLDKANQLLTEYEDLFHSQNVTFQKRIAIGDPATLIKETAEAADVDLIALGFHGQNALMDLFLGSTVYKVIHRTKTPLLIVKS